MLKIEKKKKDEKHWADWGKEKNQISKRARDGERDGVEEKEKGIKREREREREVDHHTQ